MRIKYSIVSLILMLVLLIGGISLLLKSTDIGQNEGNKILRANGGSLDTQQYYSMINHTTENYRIAGIIVSLVGGIGILLSGCGIYREIS